MADRTIEVTEPATTFDLLTLAEAKMLLGMSPTDVSQDDVLTMLISVYSATVAEVCNRTFAFEKVVETWREVNGRLFLSHWPIAADDIISVEAGGAALAASEYELETQSGKLSHIAAGGAASTAWTAPVVVEYSGGYALPGEAPAPLKQATAILIREEKIRMQQAHTAGIRMISHKGARVMFFDPNALLMKTVGAKSPGMQAAETLLRQYMRFEV